MKISEIKRYIVKRIDSDPNSFVENKIWEKADSLKLSNYLWINNGYTPDVFAKALYSDRYIYVFFKVYEKKIRIQYTNFGEDVFKDSCVEFFINLFPVLMERISGLCIAGFPYIFLNIIIRKNLLLMKQSEISINVVMKPSLNIMAPGIRWKIHHRISICRNILER